MALTADEELSDSPHNGVRWLAHHRDLIDAEFAINEGGGTLRNGGPFRFAVQLAEKVYQTYQLEVTDRGGHSAAPRPDNPIYRLAEALRRLAQFDFSAAAQCGDAGLFRAHGGDRDAGDRRGDQGAARRPYRPAALAPLTGRPDYNAQIRTTCVATMLAAGHAENALPQTARATVNCRLLPDEPVAEVERTLARVIADDKVAITAKGVAVAEPAIGTQSGGHADGGAPAQRDPGPAFR